VATRLIYRGARYSPAGRRTGSALVVKESENKIEETGGDSLEEKVIERKAVKKKLWKKKSLYRLKS